MRTSWVVPALLGLLGLSITAATLAGEGDVTAALGEDLREERAQGDRDGSLPGAGTSEPVRSGHGITLRGCLESSRAAPGAQREALTDWTYEDPWLFGERVAVHVPQADLPAPVQPQVWAPQVQRTWIHADGALNFEGSERWRPPAGDDGLTLMAYDIAHLRLAEEDLPEALRGHALPALEPAPDAWWLGLVKELRDGVGAHRWPAETTLLAWGPRDWDPKNERLLVRQDAWGLGRVEGVLEATAWRQAGAIPVKVERLETRRGADATLDLDVPWASVRAHQGLSTAYLIDYDIMMGNTWSMEPLAGALDTGLAVCARRIEGARPEGDLELYLAWSGDVPRFEVERLPLFGSLSEYVVVETPKVRHARWRGCVPACPGSHRITLDDGSVCRVTVGEEVVPKELPVPIHGQVLSASAPSPAGSSRPSIHVSWTEGRRRAERWGVVEVPPAGGTSYQWLHDDPKAREICGPPLVNTEECDEGVRIEMRAQPLSDGSLVLDFVLSMRRERDQPRKVRAQSRRTGEEIQKVDLDLPQCHVATLPRRLVLPRSGTSSLRLGADLGSGLETFALTFKRLP